MKQPHDAQLAGTENSLARRRQRENVPGIHLARIAMPEPIALALRHTDKAPALSRRLPLSGGG